MEERGVQPSTQPAAVSLSVDIDDDDQKTLTDPEDNEDADEKEASHEDDDEAASSEVQAEQVVEKVMNRMVGALVSMENQSGDEGLRRSARQVC